MLARNEIRLGKQNDSSGMPGNRFSFRSVGRSIPFLACLSEQEFRDIEAVAIQKRFARNEMILSEDDTLDFFYFVVAGRVKVVKTSFDGREHILAVRGRGDFFGEMGMLDGKTEPAAVIAMEPCEVALISKCNFDSLLMGNERVLKELVIMLTKRLREAWLDLGILQKKSAEDRIRSCLHAMANRFGIKDSRGVLINSKLTHKELADCTFLTRETVSRNMQKLARNHEIVILPGKFILLKPAFSGD